MQNFSFVKSFLLTKGETCEKPALTSRCLSSCLLTLSPHSSAKAQENISICPSSWNQRDLIGQPPLVWPVAPPGCCHCSRWFLSPLRLLSALGGPAHSRHITQTHFKRSCYTSPWIRPGDKINNSVPCSLMPLCNQRSTMSIQLEQPHTSKAITWLLLKADSLCFILEPH